MEKDDALKTHYLISLIVFLACTAFALVTFINAVSAQEHIVFPLPCGPPGVYRRYPPHRMMMRDCTTR